MMTTAMMMTMTKMKILCVSLSNQGADFIVLIYMMKMMMTVVLMTTLMMVTMTMMMMMTTMMTRTMMKKMKILCVSLSNQGAD